MVCIYNLPDFTIQAQSQSKDEQDSGENLTTLSLLHRIENLYQTTGQQEPGQRLGPVGERVWREGEGLAGSEGHLYELPLGSGDMETPEKAHQEWV